MEKKYSVYHIPKRGLLLVAGLVWAAAGFNIVRIGVQASRQSWTWLGILAAGAVFLVFYLLIFQRLVKKHTARIQSYHEMRIHILRFFDKKSYCIMAFMMTFGILLRRAGVMPGHCLRMFYTGLGGALLAAGAGFLFQFTVFNRNGNKLHIAGQTGN